MTESNIVRLTTIRNSILSDLHYAEDLLKVNKKAYDESRRSVDQLSQMDLNLNLTIGILKGREGPIPANGEVAIPQYN